MGKWKLITAGLVVLSVILCMMTIYMQREYNNMRISYNRADRDYTMLKTDYEKLYDAYYSYDKKILKILEGNKNVFWAKDSSAYLIKNDSNIFFSFYKKPKMDEKYYISWKSKEKVNLYDLKQTMDYVYLRPTRIDTLKPHQILKISWFNDCGDTILISSVKNISLPVQPHQKDAYITRMDLKDKVSTISIK